MAVELFSYPLFSDANLVNYWRLNGDSTDSKASRDGSDTSITYGSGKFDQSAGFNGTSSRISLGTSNNIGTSLFTVNYWAKTTSSGATRSAVNYFLAGSNGFSTGIYTDNKPFFYAKSTGEALMTGGTGSAINDDNWHMITVVKYATNDWKIYTDGVETKAVTTSITGTMDNAGTKYLGSYNATAEFWSGNIDDVSVFTRALTSTEILDYYNFVVESSDTSSMFLAM